MRIRIVSLVAAAIPIASALSQQKVDVQRSAAGNVSVRLSGALGGIRVIGWDRDSVVLTGALAAGSRMDGGSMPAAGPVTGLKFYIETTDESAAGRNRLELRVPRNARVWLKAGSAEIDASGVTGGLDLNIIGGTVRVSGSPRELIVESMDGPVEFGGSATYARVKTATGDIDWQGRAEDVSLTTVSGAIRVPGGAVERGRYESVTGGITFAGDVARAGDVRFDTHSGAIELRLAPKADLEVDAMTITGAIENAWNWRRPVAGREGRGMELGVSNGSGGARITVRSFKGNVRLAARP